MKSFFSKTSYWFQPQISVYKSQCAILQPFAFLASFTGPKYKTVQMHTASLARGSQQCVVHQLKSNIISHPSGIIVDIACIEINDPGHSSEKMRSVPLFSEMTWFVVFKRWCLLCLLCLLIMVAWHIEITITMMLPWS